MSVVLSCAVVVVAVVVSEVVGEMVVGFVMVRPLPLCRLPWVGGLAPGWFDKGSGEIWRYGGRVVEVGC